MEKITSNSEREFKKKSGQQFVCELKKKIHILWPSYIFDPLLVFGYVQLHCDINHMASISIQTTSD